MPRFALPLLLLAPAVFAADPPKADKDGWEPLFDGKTLDGWTPKLKGHELGDNYADTFSVKDGVIRVDYSKYDKWNTRYGHLFYKEKFGHYRLRIEYRFVGEQVKGGEGWALRNSGVMIHCQDPKTMTKDQSFPVSIEVQFLGGNGKDPRPTCNLCTPGTNVVLKEKLHTPHCTNSTSKTIHGDEWVTAEVEVNGGGTVKHFVNGELVIEYEKPQLDPKDADAKKLIKDEKKLILEEGWISLQSESHPIEFRKVEIKRLKK
ncbi:MAG: DUF1080 domain-containing protein [Fimbriiglobus sp.]|jgi:hypothetical protein|nr:DUF1080 domain-containing protein [Fimbriiglobus sp.]